MIEQYMLHYLMHDLVIHLICFQMVILLVILSNAWILYRARRHVPPPLFPKVSILIPARNEEKNIARCVSSLLAQNYPSFEVIVLDDQSSDNTRSILKQIASSEPRLSVLAGSPLPDGWLGKNWACAQLAQQAGGDLLYFTDADTVHQPQALCALVSALVGEQADLLTGFPGQELRTWGERLIVPFFSWAFYCFTPLGLAYRLQLPALSNAVGEIMLFRYAAYQRIGGHNSVSSSIVEDLSLARRIKACGLRWRVMDATNLITCHMYSTSQEAFDGLSKNLFAAFGFRLLPYLFIFLWLGVMFWEPLAVLALHALGLAPQVQTSTLAFCISLSLLLWLVPYRQLGFPVLLALLYPIIILVNEIVGFLSLQLSLTGRLTWKERELSRPQWKWL